MICEKGSQHSQGTIAKISATGEEDSPSHIVSFSPTDDISAHVAAISRFLTFTFTVPWFRGSVKRVGEASAPAPPLRTPASPRRTRRACRREPLVDEDSQHTSSYRIDRPQRPPLPDAASRVNILVLRRALLRAAPLGGGFYLLAVQKS